MSSLQKGVYNKMRTIKFRLIKDNKIISTQELKPNGIIDCSVKWDIACQFTGLLDKQGKEIYEGDIVKRFIGMKEFHFEVEWYLHSYNLRCIENNSRLEIPIYGCVYGEKISTEMKLLEVIGNVWENPELLKVE